MDEKLDPGKHADEIMRLRLQLEIVLLAWVRACLALMGFGFVVARFGIFLREITGVEQVRLGLHSSLAAVNSFTGTALILLGVAMLLFVVHAHRKTVIRLERGELGLPGRWSLGMVLCLILAVLGMGMAAYLAALIL